MTYSDGIRPASRNEPADAPGQPLWEGHRERLRRRAEREGWDALKPHEMVELVLVHALPRQDVSDLARLLVDRFGSVGGVFGASPAQLRSVEGMTERLAEWIGLTGELMRAYRDLHARDDIKLSCYRDVARFLTPRRPAGRAVWALYADFGFNLITYAELDAAAEWWEPANARRMLAEAVECGARYVYLALWSGNGADDLDETDVARLESIAGMLRAADLDLVDCVLASADGIRSMNVCGRMNAIRAESGCMELHERYGVEREQ